MARLLAASAALVASALGAPLGLYGLSPSTTLLRVFPNGTGVEIGPAHSNFAQAQQLSTIDQDAGILYLIGYVQATSIAYLVGLSLDTGAVVSQVEVPFCDFTYVGIGQMVVMDPGTGRVIVIGQDAARNHLIGTIDPVKGDFELVVNLSSTERDVFGGAAVFAPNARLLFFDLDIQLWTLSLETKKVAQFAQNGTYNILGMNFDASSGLIYGLSGGPGDGERRVVALDPVAMTITETGGIPGYANQAGGITTFDPATQSIYWLGQVTGAPTSSPFFLVQNAVHGGAVLSVSAPLNTSPDNTLWSLHVYSGSAAVA